MLRGKAKHGLNSYCVLVDAFGVVPELVPNFIFTYLIIQNGYPQGHESINYVR